MRSRLDELSDDARADMTLAINQVERFYRQEPESVETVDMIMTQAYAAFQRSRYACFSPPRAQRRAAADPVLRSHHRRGQARARLALTLGARSGQDAVTLVKCLFQQTMLSRLDRVRAGTLRNFERPVVLLCDEYSDVASELPGAGMGDGQFFHSSSGWLLGSARDPVAEHARGDAAQGALARGL